jgi:acyl-CoA synthetase (NDP forming)
VAIADALVRWPTGLPEGAGVAAISGSGGGVGVLADRLADAGFALARAPVDAGALGQGFDIAAACAALTEVVRDPRTSALVFHMTTQPGMAEIAQHLVALEREAKKPVLLVLAAGSVADDVRAVLRAARFGFHNRLDDALRVLRGLADHAALAPPPVDAMVLPASTVAPIADGPLDAMDLIARAGIAVARAELAKTPDEAIAAAARIGYPVVLKAMAAGLSHKSDAGGVVTGVVDAAALAAAQAALAARFGGRLASVLVQRQADGVGELLLGSLWDDAYGPFVVVGAGGIYAEIFADSRVAPAPLTAAAARRLIDSLRVAPILAGARGRPAADLDAAARDLAALSRLAAALGPRLLELDINPLILGRPGAGSVAVDVRIKLAAMGTAS